LRNVGELLCELVILYIEEENHETFRNWKNMRKCNDRISMRKLLIPNILLRISGNIVYEEKWMTKNITCFLRMTSHITNWMITCQIREFINLYDENNMR